MTWNVIQGDAAEQLRRTRADSVHCVVTSPPYWGLRDYGVEGAYGLEQSPAMYIANMVDVFRAVRRVLRPDGTLWLNLGDVYAANRPYQVADGKHTVVGNHMGMKVPPALKPKDLVGLPWAVVFALRDDGWWLRSDIIWHKPNAMPESVRDRPAKAHEYIFLLAKSPSYYYDGEAVKEPQTGNAHPRLGKNGVVSEQKQALPGSGVKNNTSFHQSLREPVLPNGRNRRSVWTIPTQPYPGAHFATYPEQLAAPCIKAGTSEKGVCAECGSPWGRITERTPSTMNVRVREAKAGQRSQKSWFDRSATYEEIANYGPETPGTSVTVGWQATCDHGAEVVPATVLDPFSGSGTTGVVALRLGRSYVGIELNPEYAALSRERIVGDAPLFNGAPGRV